MHPHHYVVSEDNGRWRISFHGDIQGPFSTKDKAVEAAIADARQCARTGTEIEVLVQDIESNFHSAWKSSLAGDDTSGLGTSA
jgi:hypothetical protein